MPSASLPKQLLVAIIDDHEPFRIATCRTLEAAGFATQAFGSVADFVRSGALAWIGCLILDVTMPGIDGFALQECLHSTNYELPIIFCSGVENDHAMSRALANGAASFLRKPVTAEQLVKAVRDACALQAPGNAPRRPRARQPGR